MNSDKTSTNKFYLPNLRDVLKQNGKGFSEFTDCSALIDKSPSRRAWADGTSVGKGVTETTAHKMRIRVNQVFEKWRLDSVEASSIKQITR